MITAVPRIAALVLAAWAMASPIVAQQPAEDSAKKTLAIIGYVTASYSYSTNHSGSAIVGRFYDRFHDQAVLNAAKVVFDLAPATDKLDAGFRADFLLGQNAAVTQSAGLSLGDNGDVIQAFAVVNIPADEGKYVQHHHPQYQGVPGGAHPARDPLRSLQSGVLR